MGEAMTVGKRMIARQLAEAGSSQRAIARELELNEATVSRILSGNYPQSPRARRTIRLVRALVAEKLGRSVEELFAEDLEPAAATAA